MLGDNARALVIDRDRVTGTVRFHPAYLAFCRDWDMQPRACAPYRARTKGKTEAGVKYVKRNALAERAFDVLRARSSSTWPRGCSIADQRIHGTTHEAPARSLSSETRRRRSGRCRARRCRGATQRLRRRVAHDAFVDIDTVRYSVPHRLVRDHVEVAGRRAAASGSFTAATLVATHAERTSRTPAWWMPRMYAGLWRVAVAPSGGDADAAALGSRGPSHLRGGHGGAR